jgi:hypothetical protein
MKDEIRKKILNKKSKRKYQHTQMMKLKKIKIMDPTIK